MGIIATIAALCTTIITNWSSILIILGFVYGALAAIVKFCPTLSSSHFLLGVIKFLGKITNRTTDDNAIRASAVTTATK